VLKKLSLIIIIAVLICSQFGYYFILRHQQQEQKEAVKEKIISQLKEEELESISLTDNQQNIHWEDGGKEFELKGEMYDVVKSKTVDGKITLLCINDKKETALIDHYNSITKHNSSSDKKEKSNTDNTINLFVYHNDYSKNIYVIKTKSYSSFINSFLPQPSADQTSPPPKA
jgi:hypothetical protein